MKNQIFYIIVLIFSSFLAFSQTENLINNAKLAFDNNDFYQAAQLYEDLFKIEPKKYEYAYYAAEAHRINRNYNKCEILYKTVCENDSIKRFPLSCYWLGLANTNNGNYYESTKNLQLFLESRATHDDFYSRKAMNTINSNKFVSEFLILDKNKINDDILTIDRLSKRINSPYSEFAPTRIKKKKLYFSSNKPLTGEENPDQIFKSPNYARIFESTLEKDVWQKPTELPIQINEKGKQVANISFSKNAFKAYFTKCETDKNGKQTCYIYSAELKSNNWINIEKLPSQINKNGYSSTQACVVSLNKNEEILYFSSNMPGGQGNFDIWYSIIKKNKVHEPSNLGSIINTEGNEITPFYNLKKNELYFSSDWHYGLGGYDIYKAIGGLNEWKTPQNLRIPINTPADEFYFVVNEEDSNGYFTSNRIGSNYIASQTCCNDIYSFEWKPKNREFKVPPDSIFTKFFDNPAEISAKINSLLPIQLYFDNDEPDPLSNNTSTKENYINTYKKYISQINKYKNEYFKGLSELEKVNASAEIEDFFNNYVIKGYSKLDSATSMLYEELQQGCIIILSIKGYCSPLSSNEYNTNLAKRRIASLTNYFADYKNGLLKSYINGTSIDSGRLIIKELPIGETEVNPTVSDNPNDTRNSIYSKRAALERKIEISVFESIKPKTDYASKIKFDNTLISFGNIAKNKKHSTSVKFNNIGNKDVYIDRIETNSAALSIECVKSHVKKGSSGEITVTFIPEIDKIYDYTFIKVYFRGFEDSINLKFKVNNK